MIKSTSNTSLHSLSEDSSCHLRATSSPTISRARSPSPAPAPHLGVTDSTFERKSLRTFVPAVPPGLYEAPTLMNAFQQEWEIESTLHVNGFTALQCGAEFGFPEVPDEAPTLQDVPTPSPAHPFQRTSSLGACLATPVDADTGSRAVAANFVSARSRAYQVEETVVQCVDRWSDWVRRIRRKRRMEQVQALLALIDKPNVILKRDRSGEGPEDPLSSWDGAARDEPQETNGATA